MITVGVDLSLNGTGLARYRDGVFDESRRITVKVPKGADIDFHHRRLERVEDEVARFIAGADLVVIEGISRGSFDRDMKNAGLWWIITHRCWEEGIPYAEASSSTRQKYMTTSAGEKVTKDDILDAVNSELFPGVVVATHDEADAVAFAAMGQRHYGEPVEYMLDDEGWKCIEVVEWPDIEWVVTTPN